MMKTTGIHLTRAGNTLAAPANMLLIGSQALKLHGYDIGREPRDWDYIALFEDYTQWLNLALEEGIVESHYPVTSKKFVVRLKDGRIYEFEIAWPGSNSTGRMLMFTEPYGVASPELCLALKLSHRYLKNNPAFLKTMRDIQLLRQKGVVLSKRMQTWMEWREEETYEYKHPNLNRSKQEFFDPSVRYVYDHDAVHRAVAHYGLPAYAYYMVDGAEVQCSKEKFFGHVTEAVRLFGVLEEAYVPALERSIVPHPGVLTPARAFEKALMKVCTSITSGWFREFAWENYDAVCALYSDSYVTRFWDAVNRGDVPKV